MLGFTKWIPSTDGTSTFSKFLTWLNNILQDIVNFVNDIVQSGTVFGTYTGNAPEDYEKNTAYSQTINLGFTPKAVIVYRDGNSMRSSSSTYTSYSGGLALEGHPTDPDQRNGRHSVEIVTNGFKVLYYYSSTGGGLFTNSHGATYYFIAFKNGQIVEK